MTKIETNINYGEKYEDINSGLVGVAIAITKWQHGCIRIGIQPKVKEDGTVPEVAWVDEYSLKGVIPIEKDPGGPTSIPMNHSMPKNQ